MAKGNMLLGYARGKVGSLVFSRQDGEQITRARNYHPKNPRTNPQLYQRAIMATVMAAYSQGKEIFDHSFQNKSVGNMNMREFMSRNARELRNLMSASVDSNYVDNGARVVAPKSLYMVPFEGLIISAGNYTQNLFNYTGGSGYTPTPAQNLTPAQARAQYGLNPGDIYTFIVVYGDQGTPVFTLPEYKEMNSKQFASTFGFVRLQVKEGWDTIHDTISQYKAEELFEVTDVRNAVAPVMSGLFLDFNVTPEALTPKESEDTITMATGLIRSRFDEDLRSDSVLHLVTKSFGIAPKYVIEAWKRGTTALGDSDLILEGGNF